jgi:hypothetical protein
MKTILLLLLPLYLFSQEDGIYAKKPKYEFPETFKIEEGMIYWQKTFESSDTLVLQKLSRHPRLRLTESGQGLLENASFNCKCDLMIYKDDFFADVEIEIKPGKYRVTVTNIRFMNSIQFNLYGVSTSQNSTSIESISLKGKGELRSGYNHRNALHNLHRYFEDLFVVRTLLKDSDW